MEKMHVRPLSKLKVRESVLMLACFLLVFLGVGCKKVENPQVDLSKKESLFWICNYQIRSDSKGGEGASVVKRIDGKGRFKGQTVKVIAREGFLPDDVLQEFTSRSGAEVVADTFKSSHELYGRLSRGEDYDVILVNVYMVRRLIEEKWLDRLSHGNITNLRGLDPAFQNLEADPQQSFTVPYLWSVAGIAYNVDKVEKAPKGWKDLFNPYPKILAKSAGVTILDSPRESSSAALIALGYSPNTENAEEIEKAKKYIADRLGGLKVKGGKASVHSLAKGEDVLAMAYSADVARVNHSNIYFAAPVEGTWKSIASFAIPMRKSELQKEIAEGFIEFMLEPAVAAAVVKHSYCASTVTGATAYLDAGVKYGPIYMVPHLREQVHVLDSSAAAEAMQEDAIPEDDLL